MSITLDGAVARVRQRLEDPSTSEAVARKRAAIRAALLSASTHIDGGDFEHAHDSDLRRIFAGYDAEFFGGAIAVLSKLRLGRDPLLRFSQRMTSAGGKTYHRRKRRGDGSTFDELEIAVSIHLLFHNFDPGQREVTVCGVPCVDRLDGLLRIFEHELLHLCELLVDWRTDCSGDRFRNWATAAFGHRRSTHSLMTLAETVVTQLDIRPGSRVAFDFEGRRLVGTVNRLTKRATVLVESPDGEPYTNGKRYRKYLVPPARLTKV